MNDLPESAYWNPWSPWYSDEDDRAKWHGLFLRADEIGSEENTWWYWAVYDLETWKQIESSNEKPNSPTTRTQARKVAEDAARRYIEARYLALFRHIVKWDEAYR
jgi:hypothetical protein